MKDSIEKRLIEPRINNIDSKEVAAVTAISSEVTKGFLGYCFDNGFYFIDAPHLTKATGACENFLTIFDVDFFGKPAYLSQTGQLYLEAFLPEFEKTCCYGSSFRKEDVVDNRHAVEFTLMEIEVANCNLEDLQKHLEGIFGYIIERVSRNRTKELAMLGVEKQWLDHIRPPYNVMTYEEAVKKVGLDWGADLKDKHEKELVKQNNNKPLFVTHFPQEIKFFNMRLNRQNPKIVNSMDFLMPYSGEAVGAAEREEDYERLMKRLNDSKMVELALTKMKEHPMYKDWNDEKLKNEAISFFNWYLDLVKRYPINHAGCGIGKNRVTQSILQSNDIRACSEYPLNQETLM
jgi:asparaginyl-tRNA synthetase